MKTSGRSGSVVVNPAIESFVSSQSIHHQLFYDSKVRNMGDIYATSSPRLIETRTVKGQTVLTKEANKQQFRVGAMIVNDNSKARGGVIKTPSGQYYEISTANRSAKPISQDQVKAVLDKYK